VWWLYNVAPYFIQHCVVIFSGPRGSWIICCLHVRKEFRSCDRGRQWCGILHYHWWTSSIKPMQDMLPVVFPFHLFNWTYFPYSAILARPLPCLPFSSYFYQMRHLEVVQCLAFVPDKTSNCRSYSRCAQNRDCKYYVKGLV